MAEKTPHILGATGACVSRKQALDKALAAYGELYKVREVENARLRLDGFQKYRNTIRPPWYLRLAAWFAGRELPIVRRHPDVNSADDWKVRNWFASLKWFEWDGPCQMNLTAPTSPREVILAQAIKFLRSCDTPKVFLSAETHSAIYGS